MDPELTPATVVLIIMAIIGLVLLNGFFVASEFALVKVRATRIDQLAAEGNLKARQAQHLINNLDLYLSTTQLGITLASLGLGWAGNSVILYALKNALAIWPLSLTMHEIISFTISFAIVTVLHLILGEMVPKSIAISKAEQTVLWISSPLRFFYLILKPAVWLLNKMANQFLHLFKIELVRVQQQAHTEEEIRMLVAHSHRSGFISKAELSLFDNIFDFTERIGREIMTPRINMKCLYTDYSFEENLSIIRQHPFTRFPLCERDKDDIIGIIHIRDIYERINLGEIPDMKKMVRPWIMIPESMEIKDILHTLQENRTEMAIAIDEYGGTSGIITVKNIVEEIVGKIKSEFDKDYRPLIQKEDADSTSINAQLSIQEINEHFDFDIEDDDNHTIGGWVFLQLGKIPKVGATVTYKEYQFIVQEMNERKISRLIVKLVGQNTEDTIL